MFSTLYNLISRYKICVDICHLATCILWIWSICLWLRTASVVQEHYHWSSCVIIKLQFHDYWLMKGNIWVSNNSFTRFYIISSISIYIKLQLFSSDWNVHVYHSLNQSPCYIILAGHRSWHAQCSVSSMVPVSPVVTRPLAARVGSAVWAPCTRQGRVHQ